MRLVEPDRGIARPEERREPPGGGRIVIVEQAGLGQHERPNAGRAHRRSLPRPLLKKQGRIADVGPRERPLQRVGHLEANRRHHDAIRNPLWRRANRHRQTQRRLDGLPDADDRDVEPRRRKARQFGELVGRLEGVEDYGQAGIEDIFQREHGHVHGKNDINYGVLVNSSVGAEWLTS